MGKHFTTWYRDKALEVIERGGYKSFTARVNDIITSYDEIIQSTDCGLSSQEIARVDKMTAHQPQASVSSMWAHMAKKDLPLAMRVMRMPVVEVYALLEKILEMRKQTG